MTVSPSEDNDINAVPHVFQRGARLIMRSLRLRPVPHSIAIIGASMFSVAAVALTRVMGWATDEVIIPGLEEEGVSAAKVWAAVVLLVGIGTLRGMSAVVRRYYLATARYGTEVEWRRQLFAKFLDLPMEFHRSRSTGELLAHADNDMLAASLVLMPFAFTVATLVLIVIALISLFLIHPLLALVAAVLFPVLGVMNRAYSRRVIVPAARAQAAVGKASSIAHESFDGALVVKALGHEDAEVQRLRAAAEEIREERVRAGRLRAAFEPAIDALPNLGVVVVLVLGSWLVDRGSLSVGDLVGAMALFTILAFPMRVIAFFLEELPKSIVALDRIDTVLDVETPRVVDVGSIRLPEGPLSVEVEGLAVSYGELAVLRNLNFRVGPGEVVAIVGSTGVGKSTFADVLAGLKRPTAGEVRIGGVPTTSYDQQVLSRAVAVAFQESFLFADTIFENVVLGRDLGRDEAWWALELAGADDFVRDLPEGIETVVGERGVSLSGGQRQRVALARALVGQPRVVFLDDSTAAVDPVVEGRILDKLRNEVDITLIVVAHRLSTVRLADRVVYFQDGTVGGVGTHRELLEIPTYAALAQAYERDGVAL